MKLRKKNKAMRNIEPKTEDYVEGPSVASSNKKSTKIYPRLRLEHQFFPETKNWKVGKEYTVELKLKMTGLSISKFSNDSEFDIIGFDSEDPKEDKGEGKEE